MTGPAAAAPRSDSTDDSDGLDDTFVDAYLRRLGIEHRRPPDLPFLRALHVAHLRHVPFENLSIHLGEPISLEPVALASKVIGRRRGGFCYELNGLFARLLERLGFDVALRGARVWGGQHFGPPLDHLVLVVGIHGVDEPWMADVGFGDHSVYPVAWREGVDQSDPSGDFRLVSTASGDWDLARDGTVQYRIEPNARTLSDFEAMCWYQRTSPSSHFTRSLVCTRRTDSGRVTLSGRRLIVTDGDAREEKEIDGEDQLLETYREVFGIALDRVPTVTRLRGVLSGRLRPGETP